MPTITDWLMVVITVVYVIATIFICRANIESAKATYEQIEEAKRQFNEANKAFITYEIILERWTLYGIRFTNHGKRVAEHVQISFETAFINSLEKTPFTDSLGRMCEKECILGVGQSIDVYFGEKEFSNNRDKLPIAGTISYKDSISTYRESFQIDFNNYSPVFSANDNVEDIRKEIEIQTTEIKKIWRELHILNLRCGKEKKDA